jgi:hypothetical protein
MNTFAASLPMPEGKKAASFGRRILLVEMLEPYNGRV